MRVLFLTQYFFPETGATSNRIYSLAEYAHHQGHEVLIITEKPNHPEGVIPLEFRGKTYIRRRYGPLDVLYCWVFTQPKKNNLMRLAFYASFMLTAIVGALLYARDIDVVVASSPPLFVGPAGWLISRLIGARFILDVRDIWPDVAIALGMLRNPILISLSRKLERFLYNSANGVTSISDGLCDHIRGLVAAGQPVERVMNGTVPEVFNRDEARAKLRMSLDLEDRCVILFAGNLGLAQGLDHVLEAACRLRNEQPDVLFLLLGSGPVKERLEQEVARQGLQNVRFLPRMPLAETAEHMSAADALLVPLLKHPICLGFLPSKMFDSMAAGRPVLLSVDGEARAILEAAQAGIYYPAEAADGLVDAIVQLKADPAAAARMGQNGREYVTAHCTREEQARIMLSFIQKIGKS